MPGTLNRYSNVGRVLSFDITDPAYADLSYGLAYCINLHNTTDNDIDSGTVELENADAKADNQCEPDVWTPIDPVAGCEPIVSGVPTIPPVVIEITAQRPIKAHSVCQYSIPCPKQFIRVTTKPAGVTATLIMDRLTRTDFSHYGPFGGIPQPLMQPFGFVQHRDAPWQQPHPQQQPQPQSQPAQQPAPQSAPAPRRRAQAAE